MATSKSILWRNDRSRGREEQNDVPASNGAEAKGPSTDVGERTEIRVSRSRCIKEHSFSKPARGARKKKSTGRERRSFAAFAPFLFAVKVRYL